MTICNRILLSGCTREASDSGRYLRLTTQATSQLLAAAPTRVQDKALKCLGSLTRKTRFFGQSHTVKRGLDYPTAYAESADEYQAILNHLAQRGWISLENLQAGLSAIVRVEGYEALEAAQKRNVESSKAFVAMAFHADLTAIYETEIKRGIEDAGYRSVRIDYEPHNEDVVAKILAEIRESRFVVADFTLQRNGVYFEAGFAHGLSIPVIHLIRTDDLDEVLQVARTVHSLISGRPVDPRTPAG